MKGPTLHMNHPRKTRTHGITNYAARFIYILYVHPSLKNSHPPCLPPTAHPPCKALSKKNLYPSPRSLNRTKTKVSASHGPRKKRIWMPSRLSLRIWKLRCEKRELHLWNVALGWRKVWKTHYLLNIVRKIAWCELRFILFFSKVLQTHSLSFFKIWKIKARSISL